MTLISIITPTYNHEAFIDRCIQSVLAQSYPHWELLIINDGSTDATPSILDHYAAKDSRIRVFHQPNKGLAFLNDTYNTALKEAKGRLIAILEGDDCWPDHKLATQVPLHNDPDVIFSYGKTEVIDTQGGVVDLFSPATAVGVHESVDFFIEWSLKRAFIMPVSVLIQKKALEAIGGFAQGDIYPAVDLPTFSKLFVTHSETSKVVLHDAVLGYWRSHATNTTKTHHLRIHQGFYQLALQRLAELRSSLPQKQFRYLHAAIKRTHQKIIGNVYLQLLRDSLKEGRYRDARQASQKLLVGFGLKRSTQAIVGYFCSLASVDMENFFDAARSKES